MRANRTATGIIVLSVAVLSFLSPSPANAAEFRTGDRPEIPSNETVNDDLYITGGTVTIEGRVTGDVVALGGDVDVKGQVGGSLQVIGGSIDIDGDVAGTLRVLGGDVTLNGDVGGDVLLAGGSFTLQSGGTVDGDVVVAGGDVELFGPVGGDVLGSAGSLTIGSRIRGDVDVTIENVHLLSNARIDGDLDYASRKNVSIAPGAVVTGQTRRSEPNSYYPGENITSWVSSPLFRLLCGLVAGLILVLLIPRAMTSVADAARLAPLTSLLLGLGLLVFLPVLFAILTVTLVGAPIALIGFIAYLCVLYLSQVFLGMAVGRIILPSSWDTRGRGYNLLAMTIGVLILGGLRMIPLPFISALIALMTGVVALGAVTIAIRAAKRTPVLPSY